MAILFYISKSNFISNNTVYNNNLCNKNAYGQAKHAALLTELLKWGKVYLHLKIMICKNLL